MIDYNSQSLRELRIFLSEMSEFRVVLSELRVVFSEYGVPDSPDQLVHLVRIEGQRNLFEGGGEEEVVADGQVGVDVVN